MAHEGGLWRHGDFLKLWAGQTVSQFGSQITLLALPLTAALTLHADAAQMGLLAAAGTAPYLLIGLFAGVWVDRMPRRPTLIVADIGRFALLAAIPALALVGSLAMPWLYVIGFLVGVLSVFFEIGYESYLPSLVGRAHLVDGNGKLETTRSAAQVAGPGVAGALVQLFTAPVAILADALSFLVSALCVGLIRTPEPITRAAGRRDSLWGEIGAGLRLVATNPLLRAMTSCTAALNLFGNVAGAVYILYLVNDLGLAAGTVGLIAALGAVGLVAGSLLVGRLTRRFGLGPVMIAGALVTAFGALLYPVAQGPGRWAIPVLVLARFCGGIGSVVYNINNRTLRQAATPDHLLGRVNATNRVLVWSGLPVGSLAGGTLGTVIGLRPTLWIGAAGMLVAFLWPLCSPVRTLREPPPASGTTNYNAGDTEDTENAEIAEGRGSAR